MGCFPDQGRGGLMNGTRTPLGMGLMGWAHGLMNGTRTPLGMGLMGWAHGLMNGARTPLGMIR
jgi:hypothetical protein